MSQVSDDTSDLLIEVQEPPGKRRKPKRPLSVSPEKVQESLQNLPGGNCFKCKQVLGADSKAVQCDLCGAWIHVKCEGVSDEVYSKLNAVLGDLSNLAYYCESNNCISKIKQLLYACFIDKKLEATQIQFSENEECLSKHISDLSKKIADLSAKQQSLKETVQSISSQIAEPPTCMDTDVTQNLRTVPPRSALDICDEMTDRERRKYNLVVYNFSECVDRKADIKAFKDLCNTVFKLDTSICKAIRLGPKNADKTKTITANLLKNSTIKPTYFLIPTF